MIERLKGFAVLIVTAFLFLGVIGVLGSLIFSTPSDAGPPEAAPSATIPEPANPSQAGAHVDVRGDAGGSFQADQSELGRDQVTYTNGNNRLVLGQDEDGLHVQHFTFARLDFYVDPAGCDLTVADPSSSAGFALVDFSCESIDDIRGNGTISMSGTATVPARLALTGLPELGGNISLGGDIARTLDIPEAVWFTSPQGVTPIGGHSLSVWDRYDYLAFDEIEPGSLSLSVVSLQDQDHSIDPGTCDASATELTRVSDTETIDRIDIDCPDVSLGEVGTTSIEGSVVVDHLRIEP